MHTVASNKVTAKERELAPRFYYKVAEKTTCVQRIRNALQVEGCVTCSVLMY